MLWLYVWHRHRQLRDLVVVQMLLLIPDIFWNANRNDELHMGHGGHRDNDTLMLGWLLRWRDSI